MRAARAERPNVALMDLRLAGGTSGRDASRWLLEALGGRCIFISGNLNGATREDLSAFAPVAFIGKPVLGYQLERALSKCRPAHDE